MNDLLGSFLCLCEESAANKQKRALFLYALYALHGRTRHAGVVPANPHDALLQIVKDTAGHLIR
jgi:hypothetical protein